MKFERYVEAINEPYNYHGRDLTLLTLSKMLRVTILVIHPEYLWLSHPFVNVTDASVVLVLEKMGHFSPTCK